MLFGVAEDHASNPIKIGARQAQEARRQVRLGQSRAHRLQRHRRRVDRHQARHRRAVRRGADPRAAEDAARSISTTSCATPTRRWLVIRDPGAADDGLFARDADGNPLAARQGRQARSSSGAGRRPRRRRCRAPSRWPTAARRCRCSSCWPSASWPTTYAPERGREGDAASPPPPSAASPPSWRMPPSRRRSAARHPLDRLGRPPPRQDDRPARSACTPCAASRPTPTASTPAASCTSCRSCSARSIAPAASATRRPIPSWRRRSSSRAASRATCKPMQAAAGAAPRLPDRTRGPAGRCRGHAAAHRQGLQLGRAVLRPRPDAHGDRQRRRAAIPTRSTCCSCTWPTWAGTRR